MLGLIWAGLGMDHKIHKNKAKHGLLPLVVWVGPGLTGSQEPRPLAIPSGGEKKILII